MSVRGVMTSRAFFSENSNTPSSISASCVCNTPTSWLCSTSIRNSSGECTFSSGFEARCPTAWRTICDDLLRTLANGAKIQAKARSGGVSQRATFSGCESAAPRGTSSPNTTWKKVTIASATVTAMPTRTERVTVQGSDGKCMANQPARELSVSAPSARLATVTPSWLAE